MITNYAVYFGLVLCLFSSTFANTAPTVSSVTASQRTDGSGIVDISYTLTDADSDKCTVGVVVSEDGGNTWTITPTSFTADSKLSNVSNGRWKISWNSKVDLPGVFRSTYKVKVTADDNYGPSGMVWVYINNDPGVSGHEGFTGYMSKYETTNAQYCQFLNDALRDNLILINSNGCVYAKTGSPRYCLTSSCSSSSYISYSNGRFLVLNNREQYPVTHVSWYGAKAFCDYYRYRLPSEWEWQAVADYDGSYIYSCGVVIDKTKVNYSTTGATPVGHYGAYGYGLCDMSGNVWEWTSTPSGQCCYVVRGGSWSYGEELSRVNKSIPAAIDDGDYGVDGFRVCR